MSSKGTIDLRKRKPGSHTRILPFNWGSRPTKTGGRNSPLRTRRRRTRVLIGLGVLIALATTAYGMSWVSHLPRFSITTVAVAGTEKLSSQLVETNVADELFQDTYSFLSNHNIFLYPRAEIEKNLKEYFPQIKTVKISRESLLAQAVTVTVEERIPSGRWCLSAQAGGNECYLLDEIGFIFAPEATSTPPDTSIKYTFRGPLAGSGIPIGQTFLPEHFGSVFALLLGLEHGGYFPQVVSIEEGKDLYIQLARGYSVRVSLEDDLEKTMRDLELILSSDALRGKEGGLEYIDLRFGNRVYYKFKGGEVQSQ